MQLHEATLIYVNDPKSNVLKPGSKANYVCELGKLPQDQEVDTITEKQLIDACLALNVKGPRRGLRPADGTIYSRRKVYEAFFRYAMFMNWVKKDPALYLSRHVGVGRGQTIRKNNWLTHDEVAKVLDAVDMDDLYGPRDNIFLRLGFTIGLRVSEIRTLRWSQVNFDRREISLVGKGDKIAVVTITKNTYGYLMDLHGQAAVALGRPPKDEVVVPRIKQKGDYDSETGTWKKARIFEVDYTGEPLSTTACGRICKKYTELTDIKFAPHDMRRTFAGLMFEKVDIYSLKEAMRHTDVSTTEKYLQTRPDGAAQAVRDAGLDF